MPIKGNQNTFIGRFNFFPFKINRLKFVDAEIDLFWFSFWFPFKNNSNSSKKAEGRL